MTHKDGYFSFITFIFRQLRNISRMDFLNCNCTRHLLLAFPQLHIIQQLSVLMNIVTCNSRMGLFNLAPIFIMVIK